MDQNNKDEDNSPHEDNSRPEWENESLSQTMRKYKKRRREALEAPSPAVEALQEDEFIKVQGRLAEALAYFRQAKTEEEVYRGIDDIVDTFTVMSKLIFEPIIERHTWRLYEKACVRIREAMEAGVEIGQFKRWTGNS